MRRSSNDAPPGRRSARPSSSRARLAPSCACSTVARARRHGVRATASVSEGIPFEEIVREARRRRADLIVMGTHGRTGVARLILGSVASRVLALAACSVLTVRGR